MSRPHLLLSAFDAGAGHQITHLAQLLERHAAQFSYALHAAGPAAEIIARAELPFRPFTAIPQNPKAPDPIAVNAMVAAAHKTILAERPAIVLTSLSNDGCGPDEAFSAAARKLAAPPTTATLLDDRGPLFTLDGAWPQHLLATSKATLSWARHNMSQCRSHLVGSLKHHALSQLPVARMRARFRARHGLSDDTNLITFIAQTDAISGHQETFRDLCEILQRQRRHFPDFQLVVRPHPGMPACGLWCYAEAKKLGLPVTCNRDPSHTDLLAATDILFGCTSTSMTDYVWLSLARPEPPAVPIHLLIRPAIRAYFTAQQGTYVPDLTKRGLAHLPATDAELEALVGQALARNLTAPNPDPTAVRDIADPERTMLDLLAQLSRESTPAAPASELLS